MQSRYIILDANVVIDAHKRGVWKALISQYQISLTEVIYNEIKFYEDDDDVRHEIDLRADVESGLIKVLSADAVAVATIHLKINSEYAKGVHAGELEAIALLLSGEYEDHRFCTGDAAAIKLLAVLDMGSYAISVEKLLDQIGCAKDMPWHYEEKYLKDKIAQGMIEKPIALRRKHEKD